MADETELLAVEQRHRDAGARQYQGIQLKMRKGHSAAMIEHTVAEIIHGRWDKDDTVQAFARFERDHLARIAELEAALDAMRVGVIEQRLSNWLANLKITRNASVCGDPLHGPALDYVIEQIEEMLAEQPGPSDGLAGRVLDNPKQTPPFISVSEFDDRSEERAVINGCLYLRADFAAALRTPSYAQGRAAGIEECAKVASRRAKLHADRWCAGSKIDKLEAAWSDSAATVEREIRALADPADLSAVIGDER